MTDQQADEGDDGRFQQAVAALDLTRENAVEKLRALQDAGWFWSETTANLMVNPHDSQVYVRYDPFTYDLLFAPKIVEMMRELLRKGHGGGAG